MRCTGLAVALLLPFTFGCPKEFSVWIEPGSTRDSLVIGISKYRGGSRGTYFSVLGVARCAPDGPESGQFVWLIEPQSDGPYPSRVTYGVTPPGYVSREGPEALTPGCYLVGVMAMGTRFEVMDDGSVIELKRDHRSD